MEQNDILLECDTNELEILGFQVGQNTYGINISKIVEICTEHETIEVPGGVDFAKEIFVLRGSVISVIDLFKVLKIEPIENERKMFIICELNQLKIALRVGKVNSIRQIEWNDIINPPKTTNIKDNNKTDLINGIVEAKDIDGNNNLILILDLEKIVAMLN